MATRYHNVSGETALELFSDEDSIRVRSISMVNTHASTACTVDLYVEQDPSDRFYIFKSLELPVGVTLEHDFGISEGMWQFGAGQFELYIKLTNSAEETPTVDVTMN